MSSINDFEIKNGQLLRYKGSETDVVIPDGVTSIGYGAFQWRTQLTSVIIPESVTNICDVAFKDCSGLTSVTISNGVTSIGDEAFLRCKSLTNIAIPDSVTKIGYNSFADCDNLNFNIWKNGKYLGNEENPYHALVSYTTDDNKTLFVHANTKVMIDLGDGMFGNAVTNLIVEGKDVALKAATIKNCKTLKTIEVMDDSIYFTELPQSVLAKMPPPTPTAFAYIYLQSSGKGWDGYFACYRADCNVVVSEFTNALSLVPKINKKITQKICDYIINNERSIIPSTVADFYADIKTVYPDVAKALEKDSVCAAVIAKSSDNNADETALKERHPIETLVDEYLLKNELAVKETSVVKKGLPFKNVDDVSSPDVVKVFLNEYVNLWDKCKYGVEGGYSTVYQLKIPRAIRYPEIADKIATELDGEVLSDLLESLVVSEHSSYRPYLIAYARFATAKSIKHCISLIKSRKKGNAKCKYWAENMAEALYCCDLPDAVEYIESNGDFSRYTAMRGMSIQEYRDEKSLPDFGFDAEGVKRYAVDGKIYEVRIGSTFALELFRDGESVKSIPKKTPAGETAAADFAAMKKDFSDFFKKRTEYIKSIYIMGETIAAESWFKTYCSNALLLPFAEKIIWQNGQNVFFEVTDGKIRDINGNEFIPNEPVRIAHVLDMTKEEIEQWQARIVALKKTLLIDQVWEPVASIEKGDDVTDRYNGSVLTKQERNEFKRVLKAKAIKVKSQEQDAEFNHRSYKYEFSNENTMIIGETIELDYVVDESTGDTTLGRMNEQILSREINTVLFELDRLCAKHHVLMDNHTAFSEDILNRFTLAQITEFIDFAVESKSASCTALLLDYRNKTFGEPDCFSLFVL